MKKILLFILCMSLALAVLFTATSCEGGDDTPDNGLCTEHVDENGDYACDKCGELVMPSADRAEIDVEFSVKDTDGNSLSGITVILTPKDDDSSENSVSGVSGEDGRLNLKLKEGRYFVLYDYDIDTLGYYLSETSEITVSNTTSALDLLLINNNPDGSAERPFSLSVGDNGVTLPASASYNYIVYRAVNLFVKVEGEGVKVKYGENEYTPEDGVIVFDLLGEDTNSVERFVIENTLGEENTLSLTVNSMPGTSGNPYVIEALGEEITKEGLTADDIVYYSYTAVRDGVFSVTVISTDTSASMINTRNSVAASTVSEGTNVITLEVKAGDCIIIDLSSSVLENATVSFTVDYVEAGDE